MRRITEVEPADPEEALQEIVDAHLAYDLCKIEAMCIAIRLLEEDDRLEDCVSHQIH